MALKDIAQNIKIKFTKRKYCVQHKKNYRKKLERIK